MSESRVVHIPGTFDGYLMQWRGGPEMQGDGLRKSLVHALSKIKEFQLLQLTLPPGWFAFQVQTDIPLQQSDDSSQLPYYTYFLIVRIQNKTGSVIIASSSRYVTKSIVDLFINRDLRPWLQPIQLLVGNLAKRLVFDESPPFRMTSFSGDFIHDGADVRSMILYGDDLGNAKFVKENIASVTANQVGLRERTSLREDARIGGSGNLRFYYRDGHGLASLEACLAFVNELQLYVYPSS